MAQRKVIKSFIKGGTKYEPGDLVDVGVRNGRAEDMAQRGLIINEPIQDDEEKEVEEKEVEEEDKQDKMMRNYKTKGGNND